VRQEEERQIAVRRGLVILIATASLLVPASAGAATNVSPSSLDFGTHQVGSSATRTVTVTVDCGIPDGMGGCMFLTSFTPNPSFSGTDATSFSQTNTCGGGISGDDPESCTFDVSFTPTHDGAHAATFRLGSSQIFIIPPDEHTIPLAGTGIAPAALPATPPPAKKRCKKGKKKPKGAAAAKKKKCGRKKKRGK
jgi:hypothetical protein